MSDWDIDWRVKGPGGEHWVPNSSPAKGVALEEVLRVLADNFPERPFGGRLVVTGIRIVEAEADDE